MKEANSALYAAQVYSRWALHLSPNLLHSPNLYSKCLFSLLCKRLTVSWSAQNAARYMKEASSALHAAEIWFPQAHHPNSLHLPPRLSWHLQLLRRYLLHPLHRPHQDWFAPAVARPLSEASSAQYAELHWSRRAIRLLPL
jgi:hypothetical protein